MPFDLLSEAWTMSSFWSGFSSMFTIQAAYVVLALIVIEGLLSVDNALAIAALASHLDEKKRKLAMTIGYAGAYGFRILALLLTAVIINNVYLMTFGAVYLIWLMCNHFAEEEDEEAHPGSHAAEHSFGKTIALIALLDLSLSFDNVVAAVAFSPDNIALVFLGVTIGILTLRFVAGYCIQLLEKYPWLEDTAFLLVGFVGLLLCLEIVWDKFVRRDVSLAGFSVIHGEVINLDGKHPKPESEAQQPGEPVKPKEEHLSSSDPDVHYHIKKSFKLIGIFLILIGHFAYQKSAAMRLALKPFVLVGRHAFAVVARTINGFFGLLISPFRMLFAKKA